MVPIGQYTAALLQQAEAVYGHGFAEAVRERVVSEETSVRRVRARVLLGEADAAVVYQTDTDVAGLTALPLPADLSPIADYHLGVLTDAAPAARQWADFLASPAGCAVLREHGASSCG